MTFAQSEARLTLAFEDQRHAVVLDAGLSDYRSIGIKEGDAELCREALTERTLPNARESYQCKIAWSGHRNLVVAAGAGAGATRRWGGTRRCRSRA